MELDVRNSCPLFMTDQNTTQTPCNQKESLEFINLEIHGQILLNQVFNDVFISLHFYHHLFGSGYSAVASLIPLQVPKESCYACFYHFQPSK